MSRRTPQDTGFVALNALVAFRTMSPCDVQMAVSRERRKTWQVARENKSMSRSKHSYLMFRT